jgi:hypothetical protein
MSLNAVSIGSNKYCGPAVLSILTGKTTDECARVISSINGKYTIEGVTLPHLLEAASRLGFDTEEIPAASTLYGSLIRLVNNDGLYIVTVTGHFVCIEVSNRKILFCDNHTKQPMPAASSARLQQACKAIHKVTKRREPVLTSSKVIALKHQSDDEDEIRVEVFQQITYDIEKYNRNVIIAWLKFNNQIELDEFINALSDSSIDNS